MLSYAGVLLLPRWCRQNSHVICSKTRWQSTAYTVLRYISVFSIGSDKYSSRKIWSLVKGIERTCILLFFFPLLGNRIELFFRNSNGNSLIYSRVLQSAQFCFFYMAVLAYTVYSKISKSSPPQYIDVKTLLLC